MKANKWIGVDIHKKQITVCILRGKEKENKVYERTLEGIQEFLKEVDNETIIGVESTTWTRDFAIKCLDKAKDVIIFNTIELSKIMSKVKKTDKIDAGCIALILKRFDKEELSKCMIKSKEYAEIKGLLKIRESLVEKKRRTKNEIISMLDYWGCYREERFRFNEKDKKWIETQKDLPESIKKEILNLIELIEIYENQIKEIEMELNKLLEKDKKYKKLLEIKGIGRITGAYVVSKIENINRFTNSKKLVSYFGLAPRVSISDGKGCNGRITKNTDKDLLRVLVQSAWIMIRYNREMLMFYNRLKSRTCKQKAIIAVARKIVIMIFYVLKQAEA